MRFVFDTNVIIDAFDDSLGASARLIEAVINGQLEAVVSHRVRREYQTILRRLVNDSTYTNRIQDFLDNAHEVRPQHVDVVIDDAEDRKIIEAAVGGQADAIVSSDRHLLDIGEVGSIPVITPTEAWRRFEDDSDGASEWKSFMKGFGFGLLVFAATAGVLQSLTTWDYSLLPTAGIAHAQEATPNPDATKIDESVKQLEAQQQKITDKEGEIKKLEAQIKDLKNKRDTTAADALIIAAQLKKISEQLAKAQLEAQQTQLSITVTDRKKTDTEKKIAELEDQIDEKRERLRSLLRLLYEREQESVIRIFFDTFSLSDVLADRAAYKELQDRTITLVGDMKDQAKNLQEKHQELEEQQQNLTSLANVLAAQQGEINTQKQAQQKFLQSKQEQQVAYEQKLSEVEAAKEEIKKQIFTLQGAGVELTLTNAFDMARFAGKLTGVRPALLLAVLKVESNLGTNVGSGHYPDDMQPQSREAFLRITKKLGLDPATTPVSRRPRSGNGWGGAMGPAQIMPATWESIEPRLSQLLKKPIPNPFELTDAFVATAIFLADRGA
ncbi:MAG: putative toxin-antitoxin system toxin component, PIN family [Candidatus Andersenbacteria bacterium]|nr:putative toxin-antitoxin system toxin component, PIN family [Candidatus Andersenbacteria bacterium]